MSPLEHHEDDPGSALKRPSFQFYPGDWLEEIGLRAVGLAARGLWVDMLCFMHQGEPYGFLRKGGRDISPDELARMVGASKKEVTKLLAELEQRQVFSRTDQGTIHSRRMVRDEEIRSARAKGGEEGGVKAFGSAEASRPGEARGGGRPASSGGGSEGGSEGGINVPPPSSSSPSPSAGFSPQRPLKAPRNLWPDGAFDEAKRLWTRKSGGTVNEVGLGRELGGLVEEHGWAKVKSALQAYLAATDILYLKPARFAETFGRWAPGGTGAIESDKATYEDPNFQRQRKQLAEKQRREAEAAADDAPLSEDALVSLRKLVS